MILSFDSFNNTCLREVSRKLRCAFRIVLCALVSLSPNMVMAADASRGLLGEYFASTTGELVAWADFHTKSADPGARNETATLWSEFTLKNYVSFSDSLSLETELVLTVTGPNQQSGTFISPGVINPDPVFLDFKTFMLSWQGENTEIKLGKGVNDLGFAEIYKPVDRFNSRDYSKPQHFYDRGQIQLGISRFFEASTLSFTMLPFNEDFIDPPGNSRWLNSRGDRDFFNQIGARDEDRPHKFPEDWGYLLTYSGVGSGFDYYVAAHYGPGAYPIIQLEGSLAVLAIPLTFAFSPTVSIPKELVEITKEQVESTGNARLISATGPWGPEPGAGEGARGVPEPAAAGRPPAGGADAAATGDAATVSTLFGRIKGGGATSYSTRDSSKACLDKCAVQQGYK